MNIIEKHRNELIEVIQKNQNYKTEKEKSDFLAMYSELNGFDKALELVNELIKKMFYIPNNEFPVISVQRFMELEKMLQGGE